MDLKPNKINGYIKALKRIFKRIFKHLYYIID